ncbi:hypothetical protein [Streptomyces sp. NPDC051909]|uniref:hypothetical protein n=1 Tax=Streptomyces sp. NPDC051909 TaxID=3154944 RepID=UPI00341AE3A4
MSGRFTDRDERTWQRRTEERIAEPWDLGARLRSLLARLRARAAPESCGPPAQISG